MVDELGSFVINVTVDRNTRKFKAALLKRDAESKWLPFKEFIGDTPEEAMSYAEKELYQTMPEFMRPNNDVTAIQITLLTNTNEELPEEIQSNVDNTGAVYSSCIGCSMKCAGIPCQVSLIVTKNVIALFGKKNFRIIFKKLKNKREIDQYIANQSINITAPEIVLVLLDTQVDGFGDEVLPRGEARATFYSAGAPLPSGGIHRYASLSDCPIHDVVFQMKDRFGNVITATFPQCRTLTDGAGDEVLHINMEVVGKLQYLRTPHPDSYVISLDFAQHMRKKLPGVVIENYEDVIRGGQMP